MQRDTSRRKVWVLWAVFVFLIFQFLLCGDLSENAVTYPAQLPDLYEASIAELQHGLENGHFTSVDLVKAYFARIEEVNLQGPTLRAVIELNPSALEQAAELDLERRTLGPRGPLHGIPILLKDNIATRASDGMNTTSGSYALLGSIPPRDATVAAKLRAAGAVLLGQANLSDRPVRISRSRNPSGSSSGSGIASAIGLAAAALGTETDGSIILPSSRQNLVGHQADRGIDLPCGRTPVGPMARSVADAAVILTAIAGRDPLDNFTLAAPVRVPDFSKALRKDALQVAIPTSTGAFDASLVTLTKLGATIVDPAEFPDAHELLASMNESIVLSTDFKVMVDRSMKPRTPLIDGIFDQIMIDVQHSLMRLKSWFHLSGRINLSSLYQRTLLEMRPTLQRWQLTTDLGRTRGIDATLAEFKLDAIVLPTDGFTARVAAMAGYPVVTVPLGFQPDTVVATPAWPTIDMAPGITVWTFVRRDCIQRVQVSRIRICI
ncbi:amidase signature enzyme [Lactarius indigo]|nr:amidase signature enzyme [Lactarius indigo]